jgi:death-on-curing protein
MAGRDFGDIKPIDENGFSSAVARQHAGFGGYLKHRTPHEVGATLFYGLALNHAFENGNKRTALVTLLAFLERNRLLLIETSEDELYDLATQVASHTFPLLPKDQRSPDTEVASIARWLKKRIRPLSLGDRMMRFKELRAQLEELGCRFGKPDQNFIKIFRATHDGELAVQIGYPRADYEVPVDQVKRVRRALQLDELHGIDSASFYDLEASVDRFINRYRQLLDRLAET